MDNSTENNMKMTESNSSENISGLENVINKENAEAAINGGNAVVKTETNCENYSETVSETAAENETEEKPMFNYTAEIKPEKIYTKKDAATALLCAVLGYMFIRYTFWQPYTLYSMIFNLALLGIVLFYIKANKGTLKFSHIALFALSFIFNLTFILTDNPLPKILAALFSYALTSYTVFLAASGREAFERGFVSIFLRAVLFIPFRGFEDAPKAVIGVFKGKLKAKRLGQIAAGLLMGVPLTLIVGTLLISADDGFGKILSDILYNFNVSEIFLFCVRFMFSLPITFFLFGMLYVNKSGNNQIKYTPHSVRGLLPPFMLYSAVTPVCILYILFFVTQLNYFISAFWGVLPEQFSYSQYARQGFFELCAVTVINIVLLIIMNTLCKKEDGKKYIALNIYSGMIAFSTVVLIVTAISKMVMYINEYGLSPLRVYTSWFMLLLLLLFIVIIIWGLILKLNVYKPVFAVFTVMLGILCFADIDGYIAKYNIDMYKNGQTGELDVNLLYDLSDSAVKYAVELENDPVYGGEIKDYLDYKYYSFISPDWWEWNLKTSEAQNVVNKYYKNKYII